MILCSSNCEGCCNRRWPWLKRFDGTSCCTSSGDLDDAVLGTAPVDLSVIRDLFDLSIVAYKTSTRQSIKLVLDTVRLAMEKEEVTAELQLHSDQGFQYASQSYFALTTQYGITPSMSRRANPYDNAMAENFFSILKSECIRLYKPETLHDAQTLIDEYIAFYNHERIQLNSKLSPIEKRRFFA